MSHSVTLDWEVAKAYFDATKLKNYNNPIAQRLVFEPLEKRYDAGERSADLYDRMMEVR